MQKTTNYSLPQWEAHDEVRREDFNEAMANIDTALAGAYSDTKKPYVSGSVTVTANSVGTAVATFGFTPHHVLVTVSNTLMLTQGDSQKLRTSDSFDSSDYVIFQLSNKQLKVLLLGSGAPTSFTADYVAYR